MGTFKMEEVTVSTSAINNYNIQILIIFLCPLRIQKKAIGLFTI